MEKRISYSQFQAVKSVAKACSPLIEKRDAVKRQIEALAVEYRNYATQVDALQSGILQVIGFRVEELVKKVTEAGVDCNGKPKKTTRFIPTDIVSYDDKKHQYIITMPDPEPEEKPEENPEDGQQTPKEEDAQHTVEAPAEETPAETPVGEASGTPEETDNTETAGEPSHEEVGVPGEKPEAHEALIPDDEPIFA